MIAIYFLCIILTLITNNVSANNNQSNSKSTQNSTHTQPVNFYHLPGLLDETYSQQGDINIGAIMIIKDESATHPAEKCAASYNEMPGVIEITEAVAFAVDLVNQNPNILPNVTLGFVTKSTCYGLGGNIGASLMFLPRTADETMTCNDVNDNCGNYTSDAVTSSVYGDSKWLSYDVIGVLPPPLSSYTIPVSSLYAVAHLPMVGYVVTSDELSNKDKHPYFFRIIPPDMYQVTAILKFLSSNDWSYVSVIYEDDSYGNGAYGNMQQNAASYGICIATNHRIFTFTDYEEVVTDLLANDRARVVVVFAGTSIFRGILQSVVNKNATGHFIWVGSDSLHGYSGYHFDGANQEPAIGTIQFDSYSTQIPEFNDYIRKQRVETTKNPWMKEVWEILMGCSYEERTCLKDFNVFEGSSYNPGKDAPLTIDAVLTFAHAAHNLLSEKCPDARGEEARACITGEFLLEYLKNTTFEGFNGRVEFDENQDVKGKYVIRQFVYDEYTVREDNKFLIGSLGSSNKRLFWKNVGIFDLSTNTISYFNETEISWSHLNILDRIVPWDSNSSLAIEIPESVCSRPCLVGEYKIVKKLSCCWECRLCRENERIINKNTNCEACPEFTWPDPNTDYTTCEEIELSYPSITEPIPILLTSLGGVFVLLTIFIFIVYVIYRDQRVIKASSRELSVMQLIAILTGFMTIILLQIKPNDRVCNFIFFMFCMSFTLLYAPLLVKTVRIFRIFKSSTKNEKPGFISPQSQLVISGLLFVVQVGMSVATEVLKSSGAKKTQPVWSEKMVELSCDMPFLGLLSFLCYNLVLVSLCSVFAFKVRHLPDNFNESKFISMCVATTLLIWLAFIPTYFTAYKEHIRAFLISTALLLNHSVALIFLFVPKIYAAVFLQQDTGKFSDIRN